MPPTRCRQLDTADSMPPTRCRQLDAANSIPPTRCRQLDKSQFVTDTTSTPLVNNNLKVKLYISASSWLGIELAVSKRTRSFREMTVFIFSDEILKNHDKRFEACSIFPDVPNIFFVTLVIYLHPMMLG